MWIDDRSVQRFLQGKGFYSGIIDGDFGKGSRMSSRAYLSSLGRGLTSYEAGWDDARVRIAVEQAIFESIGQDLGLIDGFRGPRTQIALERWQDHITFERPSPDPTTGVTHATVWPRQKDMLAFYGAPGTNLVRIDPPYPIYFAGKEVRTYLINEKCRDSRMRVYERTLAEYGQPRIHELEIDVFGGCFNNRPMRNGKALSTHAFACAEDWNPAKNGLRSTRETAQFARPEYRGFFDAFESEGWISLGRARNFDWMHWQAARL